jgi:hypothetical protein
MADFLLGGRSARTDEVAAAIGDRTPIMMAVGGSQPGDQLLVLLR